jgi:hypothetical protein
VCSPWSEGGHGLVTGTILIGTGLVRAKIGRVAQEAADVPAPSAANGRMRGGTANRGLVAHGPRPARAR